MKRILTTMTAAVLIAAPVAAQTTGVATIVPGPEYRTDSFGEFFLGRNWRDLWTLPITAPVLDLGTFAGGIQPFQTGGNQSKTLRFLGADGRVYIFRSITKYVKQILPDDVRNTFAGRLIEDQTSAMHPTGAVVVAPLQAAAGLLQAPPNIVIMPDDPRLGEYREEYAGLLGFIEERPDDAGKDGMVATTFDAEKIKGAENMLKDLEESFGDRLNTREYLTARLIDFLIGDTDRGADQWRWARFDVGEYDEYRPVPRDRDYSFVRSDGLLARAVRLIFPKLAVFKPEFSSLHALTFMTQEFDRSALVELSWQQWDSVTTALQSKLTDAVIADAVRQLPVEHYRVSGERIERGLLARRDALREISRQYYSMVAREADVFATDEDDVAEIERRADGSVEVRLYSAEDKRMADGGAVPAFRRLFVPDETKEIRIYLLGGNDRATVRGEAVESIKVRIAGGAGDDILIDSARVRNGDERTVLYDGHGNNLMVPGSRTRISTRPFVTPQPAPEDDEEEERPAGEAGERSDAVEQDSVAEERRGRFQDQINDFGRDFLGGKIMAQPFRSWGTTSSWRPAFDYSVGAGISAGIGYHARRYSFRHVPYYWDLGTALVYSPEANGLMAQGVLRYYPENSNRELTTRVMASQFAANRFYGFGNDTEDLDSDLTLVRRNEIRVESAVTHHFTTDRRISIGPVFKYVDARPPGGSPAEIERPLAADEPFGQLGVRARAEIDRAIVEFAPRKGYRARITADVYPVTWDGDGAFGSATAEASAYVPIGSPVLAFRAGGKHVWGDFPLHEAAFLGGRTTLRGYAWNRFAGDAAAWGAAELRAPVIRTVFLLRGTLGLTALADVGRVWFNGESDDGWHTGAGGGIWFASLNRSVSVTYAAGESGRVYFQYGMPF